MEISIDTKPSGWLTLSANPTEYSGRPTVSVARLKMPLSNPNPDRLAVAASLIFAPFIAGKLQLPVQFSPLTAERISEWFQTRGVWVSPGPVRTGSLPIPRGQKTIQIGPKTSDLTIDPYVHFSAPWAGTSWDPRGITIASNLAFLHNSENVFEPKLAEVGMAVLVAETLNIDKIRVPRLAQQANAFVTVRRLLEAVSLGLIG